MLKKVKILNTGIIPGTTIMGPILNPIMMDTTLISSLIIKGAKVEEVLTNGTIISLNMTNYLEDNENKFVVKKEEVSKIERKALEKINKRRSYVPQTVEKIDKPEEI